MNRVTVEEAARLLGIEKESVRKRVYRGQLQADKEPDGTLRVYLDEVSGPYADSRHGQYTDEMHGRSTDNVHGPESASVQLIASLQDQIEYLRRESERKDAIIMQMAQANAALAARIPELEAPTEPREGRERTTEDNQGVDHQESSTKAQKGTQWPWWRRLLGG